MEISLNKLWEVLKGRETDVLQSTGSQRVRQGRTTEQLLAPQSMIWEATINWPLNKKCRLSSSPLTLLNQNLHFINNKWTFPQYLVDFPR